MKKILKKGDYILLAVLLCVCTVCFVCIHYFVPTGNTAVITVDNKQVHTMKLTDNAEYNVVINDTVANTVVVENGYVYVKAASCPDKICQHHKKINKKGESIVCLPNKMVVRINGADSNEEIDGVVT